MTYVYLAAGLSVCAAVVMLTWCGLQIAAEYSYEMELRDESESDADDGTVGDGKRARDG
jgi:hypothetical protein